MVQASSRHAADAASACVDLRIQQIQNRMQTELGFRQMSVGFDRRVTTDSSSSSCSSAGYPIPQPIMTGKLREGCPAQKCIAFPDIKDSHGSDNDIHFPSSYTSQSITDSSCSLSHNQAREHSCIRGTIFASPFYDTKQRLLVIVPYREAGVWSRSICMNKASQTQDDAGSMLSYLRKALSENYGILIMNPAAQSYQSQNHVLQAWEQFVMPLTSDVFILAFSRGSQLVKHVLMHDNGMGIVRDRLQALAFVEPSHYVHDSDPYFTRHILACRAVSWILSDSVDVGMRLPKAEERHGCVCISAGTVPPGVKGSNGAWAIDMVMTSVFGCFAARCGEAAGVTVNDNKILNCGMCYRKLGVLNRKFQCSWCEVKYCSRCCEDKFVKVFECMRVCLLCQSLPCLLEPGKKRSHTFTRNTLISMTPTQRADSRGLMSSLHIDPSISSAVALDDFEIIKLIGRGACGRVKLVRKKNGVDEGMLYAMKSIRKKLVIQRGLVQATNAERRILDRINHPYIAGLCYAFQNPAKLYLLSKYYPGGNLLDQMRLARRFSEDRTKLYAAEVALALHHLHTNNIMYRDLKLENVLVDSDGHIALTDFGMSKECASYDTRTNTFVGTYQMMAPEVFTGRPYSRAVDWWALGVMVYEMIDGRTPFNAKTNRLIRERITNVDLKFSSRFTAEAKNFVSRLLTKDERLRLGSGPHGFEDIKSHPWFCSISWSLVANKKASFSRQVELMARDAKELEPRDIFETLMNAREKPLDTPVSRRSLVDEEELFQDFFYDYLEDSTSSQGPSPTSSVSSPLQFDIEKIRDLAITCRGRQDSHAAASIHSDSIVIEDIDELQRLEDEEKQSHLRELMLTNVQSQFDIRLLRPYKASDFCETMTPFTSRIDMNVDASAPFNKDSKNNLFEPEYTIEYENEATDSMKGTEVVNRSTGVEAALL